MKKTKTLDIEFEDWGDFKKRTKLALHKGQLCPTRAHSLIFRTVTDYQKFMTEQKLAILAVILNQKPASIYLLAQLVDRDFANVQRDCVALESMGFIRFKDMGDERNSKCPTLAFDYTIIVIHMPKVSYSHHLLLVA